MGDYFITKEGLEKLKEQLEYSKTVERVEVAKMIGEAKSFGDLRENSEYDAAKTKETQLEMKILDLENKIKNAKIINKTEINSDQINIGCTVELYDETWDEQVTYKIMGAAESDPLKGLISNESPVGKAILGKKVGDIVKVETPGGICVFKILKISVI